MLKKQNDEQKANRKQKITYQTKPRNKFNLLDWTTAAAAATAAES